MVSPDYRATGPRSGRSARGRCRAGDGRGGAEHLRRPEIRESGGGAPAIQGNHGVQLYSGFGTKVALMDLQGERHVCNVITWLASDAAPKKTVLPWDSKQRLWKRSKTLPLG